MDLSTARYQRIDRAAVLMGQWLLNGSGPGGGSLFSTMLFHSFNDPNYPELQIYMTPMNIDENLSDGENESASIFQSLGRKLLVRGKKVAKPNTTFDLSIRDIEIIEHALRAKAGRRGLAIAQGETSPELRREMNEIQEVLGKIHNQKNYYAKFKDGKTTYVSG